MTTGFIGLGFLGKTIAKRLQECGHKLVVWNRSPAKAGGLQAEVVDSPAHVAKATDVVFLCLFDSDAVRNVMTGAEGLLDSNLSGKIIVDLTTNHFRDVTSFHDICKTAGALYLEAPVLGSVVPASKGALTILVSGSKSGYDKVKPLLEDIGNHLFYLEKPALATKMKLINNLTLGSFMATIAEALVFGEDVGIDKKRVLDILAVGGGDSLVLKAKKQRLEEEDYSTHFSNALIYKDLHCLMDLAFSLKRPLLTGAVAKEMFAKTYDQKIEDEDFCAIYKTLNK